MRFTALSWWVGLLLALMATPASAHFAPSLDTNNRYLKLTPMGDRVRLAYTVYMGEQPGAEARQRLDANHDGMISDAEADVFGKEVATDVLAALEVTADGKRVPIAWKQRYVGLGTPTTRGGSFSVDLVAWICLAKASKHSLLVFDRFEIPRPGETEVRIEESPGVHITRSTLGKNGPQDMLDMKWMGGPGPAASDGIYLEFTADGNAADLSGEDCQTEAAPASSATPAARNQQRRPSGPRRYVIVGGLAALLAIGAALVIRARRYRNTNG